MIFLLNKITYKELFKRITETFSNLEANRSEVYTIKYSNGDIKNSSYDEWMQTELGDSVTITKCRLGIVYNQTEE